MNPRPTRKCEWGSGDPTMLPWINTGRDKREVRERDKGDKGRQESNDIYLLLIGWNFDFLPQDGLPVFFNLYCFGYFS